MDNDLTKDKLVYAMAAAGMGGQAAFFPACTSTNTVAREMEINGAPDLSVVLSSCQTAGKGRSGRQWISKDGTGLYASVLMRPKLSPAKMPLLALVTAVAAREAVAGAGGAPLIKWPNDIVLDGKKVCGILLEAGPGWAVAGIGVNVSHTKEDFPPELWNRAASLEMLGVNVSRDALLSLLLSAFAARYRQFANEGPEGTLALYRQYCATLGKEVSVTSDRDEYRARATDIAADGALVIEREGKTSSLYWGDVSVRGIMGYV